MRLSRWTLALALGAALGGCDDAHEGDPMTADPLSGGATTVFSTIDNAFSLPASNASVEHQRDFFVGDSYFTNSWVTAPASAEGRDGLGPTFNAVACASCHIKDGRGRPPASEDEPTTDLLIRLSIPGDAPGDPPRPVPGYGDQLNTRAILGVPAEGRAWVRYEEQPGAYADGTPYSLRAPTYDIGELAFGPLPDGVMMSPRVAPALPGLGLLEAVPEEDIIAREDPTDADGDGISGRVNRVYDIRAGREALGRFGWKANQPTLEQQNAGAFLGDIGVTSALFPDERCPPEQAACAAAPTGGSPELDASKLARVTLYTQLLAVPARRDIDDAQVRKGEALFAEAGCAGCHTSTMKTGGDAALFELRDQVIHPYTDLLLHGMGEGLADGRPDGLADGREWRTPPLWGIGLIERVNGHTFLLHDGRARGFAEAILWHGGEAEAAKERFRMMDRDEREALVIFLESL